MKHWDVMRSDNGGDSGTRSWQSADGFWISIAVHAHEPETVFYVVPIKSDWNIIRRTENCASIAARPSNEWRR